MTVTIAFAWWHVAILLLVIGGPMMLFGGAEGGGYFGPTPRGITVIGIILCLLAVSYLMLGGLARALP